jgi:tellurite methyltransferase
MTYDRTYKNTENVFGTNPEIILKKYANKIEKARPVLDIGIGQGRNSFYLAKEGFKVDGIDPSSVAIESVLNISQKENLKINAYQIEFRDFVPKNTTYSAILLFGLIQILDWDSIHTLIDRINQWTQKGSLIFITAFSTKTQRIKSIAKIGRRLGKILLETTMTIIELSLSQTRLLNCLKIIV